jgi:NADH:ubiquinone oxidoreductase subunit 6 (subunit J)
MVSIGVCMKIAATVVTVVSVVISLICLGVIGMAILAFSMFGGPTDQNIFSVLILAGLFVTAVPLVMMFLRKRGFRKKNRKQERIFGILAVVSSALPVLLLSVFLLSVFLQRPGI